MPPPPDPHLYLPVGDVYVRSEASQRTLPPLPSLRQPVLPRAQPDYLRILLPILCCLAHYYLVVLLRPNSRPSDHLNSSYFAAGIPTRDPPSDTFEHPFSANRPSSPDSYPAPLATTDTRANHPSVSTSTAAPFFAKRLKPNSHASTLPRPHARDSRLV